MGRYVPVGRSTAPELRKIIEPALKPWQNRDFSLSDVMTDVVGALLNAGWDAINPLMDSIIFEHPEDRPRGT